jgi:hypothetical protein
MWLEYDNRNILSGKKIGITVLDFELSAPESEFLSKLMNLLAFSYQNLSH